MSIKRHWLIVVRQEQRDVYSEIRQRLEGIAWVIFDRRQAERRRVSVPVDTDRRRCGERRRPLPAQEHDRWYRFGHQILYRPEGFEVGDEPDA